MENYLEQPFIYLYKSMNAPRGQSVLKNNYFVSKFLKINFASCGY
jgi:hypothetical protein